MTVGLLLFPAWTLGHEIILSFITDFPNIHEILCVTAQPEKEFKRSFISISPDTTVPHTEHVRNQFKVLDNPQELRNTKAELRLKLIELKAA